jgi:predicted Ser/Thr protein kinase
MKYETAILLGKGAMGEVYKAFDPVLQRFVALKYLRKDDPGLAERLLREARLQARVEHEMVCKVYEVGTDEGRPFIAMQFIEGRTLEQAAADMTLGEKMQVVRDVAEAVHAAHETGLIHRDLKPQNIMVERRADGTWRPHVLDFGLARESEASGLTASGAIVGTPPYMAPEQARGDLPGLDRRTDVYALGAVLYRLVTGRPPFEGGHLDVAMRVIHTEPVPPRRVDPTLPVDIEAIVLKCLEKDRDRRYPTAQALARDLQRFLDGEAVEARSLERLETRSFPEAGATPPSGGSVLDLVGRGFRIVAGVSGVFLAFMGSFFVAFAIDDLFKSAERAQYGFAMQLAFLGLAAGMVAAGALTTRWSVRSFRAVRDLERDRALLALAARSGGHLSMAEVVLRTGLSIEESQSALQRLSRKGLAEMIVNEDGTLGYVFTGLLSPTRRSPAVES